MQDLLAAAGVQGGNLFEGGQRDLVGGRVGEADVVEFHGHRTGGNRRGVRFLGDQRLEVQDLEDPLEADQRAHDLHPGVGQGRQRGVQPGEEQREHHHVAGCQLAAMASQPPIP